MVNLSLDPPPFGRGSGGGGLFRWIAYLVVLALGIAGGFYAGRKTVPILVEAPHEAPPGPGQAAPSGPAAVASPSSPRQGAQPAPGGSLAAPGASRASAPALAGGASAPAGVAVPGAAAVAPGAPQGPLVRHVSVTLRGPLEESVSAAMPPADKAWAEQLTQVVNRLLVWSLNVSRDARKGDKLEVLYELPGPQPSGIQAVNEAGPVAKEPVVMALRYGSQKLGKLLTAYRFRAEGSSFAHYYTSEGVDVEEHLVDGPVDAWEQVTSLLRDGRRHKGVDFKTPVGTPVKAPFDGTITRRNWHFSANGNCLEIALPNGGRVIFLHLEAVPKEMAPGRKVRKGEVVAKSGNTGHSTAPHLHYQLEGPGGKVLDPYAVQPTRTVKLEGAAKAAFELERQRLEPLLVAATAR